MGSATGVVRIVLVGLSALGLVSCGDAPEDEAAPYSYDDFVRSVTFEYDPAGSLEELAARSDVVAEVVLSDVEDGAIFGDSPDDPDASRSVNLIFTDRDGETYYVEVPRPTFMSAAEVKAVLPVGSPSVVYLQPNRDPRDQNFFQLHDGPTWFFTTPQGWIQADPARGISTPLEQSSDLGLARPVNGDRDIAAWLPPSGS